MKSVTLSFREGAQKCPNRESTTASVWWQFNQRRGDNRSPVSQSNLGTDINRLIGLGGD